MEEWSCLLFYWQVSSCTDPRAEASHSFRNQDIIPGATKLPVWRETLLLLLIWHQEVHPATHRQTLASSCCDRVSLFLSMNVAVCFPGRVQTAWRVYQSGVSKMILEISCWLVHLVPTLSLNTGFMWSWLLSKLFVCSRQSFISKINLNEEDQVIDYELSAVSRLLLFGSYPVSHFQVKRQRDSVRWRYLDEDNLIVRRRLDSSQEGCFKATDTD